MLLLCTSQYPTPAPDVNISKISTLRSAFPGLNVGFSDHTAGSTASIMAVALGATLFEKHFTLSKDLPGPDHWFSESPESLALWVQGIREASMMTGNSLVVPTKAEYDMRTLARRSIVAVRDIEAGQLLSEQNIAARRPGNGMPAAYIAEIIGLKAVRKIQKGELVKLGDFAGG